MIDGDLPNYILELFNSISNKINQSNYSKEVGFTRDVLDLVCCSYVENLWFKGFKRSFRDEINLIPSVKTGKRKIVLPSWCLSSCNAKEEDLTISITNINLVDTKKTEWPQIIEFRNDKQARKKLRNLRLFLTANYEGKSISFIEDDLSKRLDEYKDVCKDWGFETRVSTIMALMDSKYLRRGIGASFAAAILGEPVYGISIAATATLLEVGKVALCLSKKLHEFNKLKRDHDLAYIIEARKLLE